MNLDLRKPLGAMFSLLGMLLVVYGLISRPEIYQRSFNLNVNLIWGSVLLVFGVSMLWLGRTRTSATTPAPSSGLSSPRSRPHSA